MWFWASSPFSPLLPFFIMLSVLGRWALLTASSGPFCPLLPVVFGQWGLCRRSAGRINVRAGELLSGWPLKQLFDSGIYSLFLPAGHVAVSNVKKKFHKYETFCRWLCSCSTSGKKEMPHSSCNLIFILCLHFAENVYVWFQSNCSSFIFLGFGPNFLDYKFGT